MEDYNEFLDLEDEDDRRTYDTRYLTKLKDLTGSLDTDEQDEVIDELKGIRYNPSNSPENDCELNYLKTRNVISQKSKLPPATASYLRHIAERDGKTMSEVTREYRKLTKGGDR